MSQISLCTAKPACVHQPALPDERQRFLIQAELWSGNRLFVDEHGLVVFRQVEFCSPGCLCCNLYMGYVNALCAQRLQDQFSRTIVACISHVCARQACSLQVNSHVQGVAADEFFIYRRKIIIDTAITKADGNRIQGKDIISRVR